MAGDDPCAVRTSADCALDALVVAAAIMIAAQARPSSAARMCLLALGRRSALLSTPPRRNVLAELDVTLAEVRSGPAHRRVAMNDSMDRLVGSPWAGIVLDAAERIGTASAQLDAPGKAALAAIGAALGLEAPAAR